MHIALVCPAVPGHLNPMTTLGAELARRGHRVTLFSPPLAADKAARCGLEFHPIAVAEYESGWANEQLAKLATMKGLKALSFTGRMLATGTELGLRDLPDALRKERVEGVLTDQVSPEGGCAADLLRLPFVVACNALALHTEPGVPPVPTAWPYHRGFLARLRNQVGNLILAAVRRPARRAASAFRAKHRLPPVSGQGASSYALAQLAQQPEFFDYPREQLPSHFHYTGPWHAHGRDTDVTFPWEKLGDRPLVYASLGTLQNRLRAVFEAILEGCSTLPVQVVLSLGRRDAVWDGAVPANAMVVPFAPQLELVKRAAVVVTHAGLNTALETLAAGKPMLCLPVTNDQPGVAGRVAWLGAGEWMNPKQATAKRVRASVERLLTMPAFRQKAEECRDRMAKVDGPQVAADVVERALTTGKRVDR